MLNNDTKGLFAGYTALWGARKIFFVGNYTAGWQSDQRNTADAARLYIDYRVLYKVRSTNRSFS